MSESTTRPGRELNEMQKKELAKAGFMLVVGIALAILCADTWKASAQNGGFILAILGAAEGVVWRIRRS